jgi:hypothetical protein
LHSGSCIRPIPKAARASRSHSDSTHCSRCLCCTTRAYHLPIRSPAPWLQCLGQLRTTANVFEAKCANDKEVWSLAYVAWADFQRIGIRWISPLLSLHPGPTFRSVADFHFLDRCSRQVSLAPEGWKRLYATSSVYHKADAQGERLWRFTTTNTASIRYTASITK